MVVTRLQQIRNTNDARDTGRLKMEVVILDSSSDIDLAPRKRELECVDLLSDEDNDEQLVSQVNSVHLDEPLMDRVQKLLSRKTPSTTNSFAGENSSSIVFEDSRESLFDAFYDKWVASKETSKMEDQTGETFRVELREEVLEPEKSKSKSKPPKKIESADVEQAKSRKRNYSNVESSEQPIALTVPSNNTPLNLDRQPRTKDEACRELCMVIDERLNARLQLAPQMSQSFEILIDRLEHTNMVAWKRKPWDRPGASLWVNICAFIIEAETDGGDLLSRDPESFIKRLSAKVAPNRYSQVYIILTGFKAFGTKISTQMNKQFRDAVLNGERLPKDHRNNLAQSQASWSETENRLWIASSDIAGVEGIQSPFRLIFLETLPFVRQFLLESCRDIAWLPYNTGQDRFNFCTINMGGPKRTCEGPTETLKLMLCQILRVTPSIASAVCRIYPTLPHLMAAYERLSPVQAAGLLQGIALDNGRSLGQALSSRIYSVLTGRNPEVIIK